MRVATWCIEGVRAHLEVLCQWLKDCRPAVVALQKIRAPDGVFPAGALAQVGYRSESLCRRGSYGVALLSRRDLSKPQILHRGLPGGDGSDDGLLTARLGDLVVSSVYVPFRPLAVKLDWLDRLDKYVAERGLGSGRSVLCGDFNVLPDVPCKPGVLGCAPEEKRQLQAIRDKGFEDLYRCANPNPSDEGFNFRSHLQSIPPARLQLVLGSESVAASVVGAWVGEYRGQCAPVIVELDGPA